LVTEVTSLRHGVEEAVRQIIAQGKGRLRPPTLRECVRAFTGIYEPDVVVAIVEKLVEEGSVGAAVEVSFYEKGPSTDFRLWVREEPPVREASERLTLTAAMPAMQEMAS
jgi:hypothetical protein